MRHTTLWLPLVAFLLQPSLSLAQAADATPPPTMTVTASAEVRAVPDMAIVQLGVDTRGSTAQEAMAKNNALANQIVDALKKLGIPDNQLQTSYINLSPVYSNPPPRDPPLAPQLIGFEANNVLAAELIGLDQLAKLGPAIDASVAGGANQIQGISFQLSDDQPFRLKALQAAGARARAKADALAAGLGVTISSVASASEAVVQISPVNRGATAPAPADNGTPVLPGELIVQAQVQVQFAIKQ
jgi:uncharacterized protein YggE